MMNARALRTLGFLGPLAVMAMWLAIGLGQSASAAPGDLIAEVTTPEGSGWTWARGISPSVAFDGQYLYYVEYAGVILHRIDVPPAGGSTPAANQVDVTITGAQTGIMSISYDAGRGVFWATSGDGLTIYTLTKAGVATPQLKIDPVSDRPGFETATFMNETKLAYDRSDDTIWYSPDATRRIYHYQTTPDALGRAVLVAASPFIDVDMAAECGYSQSSGVVTGGAHLFVSISGCPRYFEFTKTGLKVGSYSMTVQSAGGLACDSTSYGVSVIWVKDQYLGQLRAYEQPSAGACVTGG